MFVCGAYRISVMAALLVLASAATPAATLDIDGDGTIGAQTDGQLILRHLFGFGGDSLVSGVLSDEALRDTAGIEGYLAALDLTLDLDGDGSADALTDGLLVLRYLLGRTGAELTDGVLSPAAARDAAGIADRIDALSTPPGEAPASVELVQANSLTANSIQLDWLPTFDNDTPGSDITYVLHAGEIDNFVPDATTARTEVVDDATGVIQGLTPATTYYVKVEARDSFGHNSWSNQLSVLTAEFDPQDSAAPRQVLDEVSAPVQTVEPDRVDYQLGAGVDAPSVGDILVSGEGDGFLRRAAAVTQTGDQISVDTEPAALNELYENLSVSTDIKLIDLPETSGPTARAVGRGVIFQRSGDTKRAVWPHSGLTLIERRPAEPVPRAAVPTPRASTPGACDGQSGQRESEWDKDELKVTFPKVVCVEPNTTLTIDISAEIASAFAEQFQVTQLLLVEGGGWFNEGGVTHPEIEKVHANYGAKWKRPIGDSDTRGVGTLRWTPEERHVDGQGRPYTAHFVALAKERDEYCQGVLDRCKKREVEFEVDIYVTWGSLSEPGPQSFSSAEAGIEISASAKIDFEPRISAEAEISGANLTYGRVAIKGPVTFETEINLHATAAAEHESSKQLIDKQFVKLYYAGNVPIVITGHFQLDVQFRARADADLDITQTLTTGYDIKAGLEYRDGGWHLIDEAQPWQRYRLSGEADTHAYVELRFVPDLELTFYDVATGRLILEPYLYGEAALEGHFLYQYEADGSGVIDGGDADYRFTQLEFGAGIDGKFRAGLEVFDKSIVGYPSRDQNQFVEFALLERTPFVGLPDLYPQMTGAISAGDCTAVELTAAIENVPNPFRNLFGGPESWNPFTDESSAWEVVLPNGTERISTGAGPRDAWFSASSAGQYQLRFSGHSALGSYVRQYEEITVNYDPAAGDCSIFGTLQVSPPSGAWDSSPQWISVSGADVQTIYYSTTSTYDGNPPPDPTPPTQTTNDGFLNGPNASFELHGVDDVLTRTKLSFVGCSGGQCGPISGPYEYRIDLRSCVEVTPPSGSWTSSPQILSVSSPGSDTIYYSMVDTYDGSLPVNPAAPTPAVNDGVLTGPDASLELQGSDDQIMRTKLRFVGCSGNLCGPACEAFEYRIDLRGGTVVEQTAPLNDTGIDWCANADTNFLACPVAGFPGQDAEYGRDVTHNDDSDGHAGFSFTKLDADGNPLPASATDWSCVRDNVTSLVWEIKAGDGGARDKSNTYSWYNGNFDSDDASIGIMNGGNCNGAIACDTEEYSRYVNELRLCGISNWRLPQPQELLSIVRSDRVNPAVDAVYFPFVQSYAYWSDSSYSYDPGQAWYAHLGYGYLHYGYKGDARYLLLVSAEQ